MPWDWWWGWTAMVSMVADSPLRVMPRMPRISPLESAATSSSPDGGTAGLAVWTSLK